MTVAGITDERQFSLRPTVFVPLRSWDRLRPGSLEDVGERPLVASFVAVQAKAGASYEKLAAEIALRVPNVEVADLKTAYEATPGYREQQSTLSIQQGFTWFAARVRPPCWPFWPVYSSPRAAAYSSAAETSPT